MRPPGPRRAGRLAATTTLAALGAVAAAPAPTGPAPREADDRFRVLLFSRTAGFRHDSIPRGVEAIQTLGREHGFGVDATEDAAKFTDEGLARYSALVFLNTTGDVLDDAQQAAFERYIRGGGGWAGVHAAADAEYDWPWYGSLMGAYFKGHPAIQEASVIVADRAHPSTRMLPERWVRTDEWYDYRASPRGSVHVLAALHERSYEGGAMGHDHPIAWCQLFEGGRAWYTGGGHTVESYAEPLFLEHLLGGILWAAGRVEGDAGGTVDRHFEKVVLDDHTTDPMELAVAPDGRVIFVERGGVVKIWRPDLARTVTAGFIDVFSGLEDGLLGIALDPTFAENGWVYLYHSPAGDVPVNLLSRFTLQSDALDPLSEVVVLEVPTQREECCHSGGSLAFDGDGNLYLSTGDNTSPFASDGYSPIDERPDRMPFDAQKSSASTHDLRGKILRIRPEADGTYSIPPGNLFPPDGAQGRPEIYVMGCRNPFRISVDPEGGWLFWGDVGPDASDAREGRGPAGHDEFNRTRQPGNFGWPYFIADNRPYHDHDFQTGVSGPAFDPSAPVNESPSATGHRELPPAQPAWIWYPYGASEEFPELGEGGRCAMAGPVVHHDPTRFGERALPPYYDGAIFLYEWARDRIFEVRLDEDGGILQMNTFLPGLDLTRPMELELGPDGCLYLIEWGTGFGGGNDDAQVCRLEYFPSGERPPVACAAASPSTGPVPLSVRFTSDGSRVRSGPGELRYAWDLDGDGATDSTGGHPAHVYAAPANVQARLTVTDAGGRSATATVPVRAGNSAPRVAIAWPPDGAVVGFGDRVEYRATVVDPEDGTIDPQQVTVRPLLGHDTHAHPLRPLQGTAGTLQTLLDAGHGADADLFTVVQATYTDRGAPGVERLTGSAEIVLQPRRKQAEHASSRVGTVRVEKSDDPCGGGQSIVFGKAGEHVSFRPLCLQGIEALALRVASGSAGGGLGLRLDSPQGPLLATAAVQPRRVSLEAGAHPVRIEYFERTGEAGLILRVQGGGLGKQVVPASMLSRAAGAGAPEPGLEAAYYELLDPKALPDFTQLTPYRTEAVPRIDFPSTTEDFAGSGRADHVGAVFSGLVTVPRSGHYTFFIESDDGAKLYLDGARVIDNDGLHAMVEKSADLEWSDVRVEVADPGGTHELFVVYAPTDGEDTPLKLTWIEFHGPGVATAAAPAPAGGGGAGHD